VLAILTIALIAGAPALSAELIWKDRWNNMDQIFRMGYAAGVYDTSQVLNPISISLKNMPGATIGDDLEILLHDALGCLNAMKTVREVRQFADEALATRPNPKESVALVIFISFVNCGNAARAGNIDEEQSKPWSVFEWKDRWDRDSEQFKNGYAAGVADMVQYLASVGTFAELRILQASIGPCGANRDKSNKLETFGDLLRFAEKALDNREDLFASAASVISDALRQCNKSR
jgi:hypothetical protein